MANFTGLLIIATLVLILVGIIQSRQITDDENILNNEQSEVEKDRKNFIDVDCNGHGQYSLNSTECECYQGWITLDRNANRSTYCAYKQRLKKTAFFLSLFFGGFGVDWFYLSRGTLGYIIAGILKLLFACICCGGWPSTYFVHKIQSSELLKKRVHSVNICFTLVIFAWWIVDWARILNNRFTDGLGVALVPW